MAPEGGCGGLRIARRGAVRSADARVADAIVDRWEAETKRLGTLEALLPEITQLARGAVEALLGVSSERDEALLRASVARALEALPRARRVLVRVHPDDSTALMAWLSERSGGQTFEALAVEGDATVERGGVMVESERGRVDATTSTRLSTLLDRWAERVRGTEAR